MDVNYINPFLSAAQNLFDTMIDLPVELGKPTIKKDAVPFFDISSIIGLSGDVTGCVVINLSEELALRLASALLGQEMHEINEDSTDAIGEIANMIAGNAKTDFPTGSTSISVPSVVVGKHKVSYPAGIPIVSIPCQTQGGLMVIDIAIAVGK